MSCTQYKMFFNDKAATIAQLESFETITVNQEMDHAWVAHLEVPLCTDDKGNWTGESETWFQPMNRLRIEVAVQGGSFAPLIDGPIASLHHDMHMEPGQSIGHVEVHDDGYLLHRDEKVQLFSGTTTYDDIAQQVYDANSDVIKSTQIDTVPAADNPNDANIVLRGTPMQFLHHLARRLHHKWHAFVLPGSKPHQSIGCFQKNPIGKPSLPGMVLKGDKPNLLYLRPSNHAGRPAVYRGGSVSLSDATSTTSTADLNQIDRLGTDAPGATPAKRMLRPGRSRNLNLDEAVLSASDQAGHCLNAEGEVLKDTYSGVLQPYQNVMVTGVNGRLSGLWTVRQVTHTLTRNSYGQTFGLHRDAESAGTGSSSTASPLSIF